MARAYISAKPENSIWIKTLRDEISVITEASPHYSKVSPHITVVPPFSLKDENREEVTKLAKQTGLEGKRVKINGLSVYSNIHNPLVLMLDIDVDMNGEREHLISQIKDYTNGSIKDPVDPHITLMKVKGRSKDLAEDIQIPNEVKKRIQREILYRSTFKDTKIDRVETEFKN